jgi:hypothetical protein
MLAHGILVIRAVAVSRSRQRKANLAATRRVPWSFPQWLHRVSSNLTHTLATIAASLERSETAHQGKRAITVVVIQSVNVVLHMTSYERTTPAPPLLPPPSH